MYKDKLIVLNTIHISHLIFLITMRITIWKTNHIHGIKRNPMFYSDNCQKHPTVLSVQLCSRNVKLSDTATKQIKAMAGLVWTASHNKESATVCLLL